MKKFKKNRFSIFAGLAGMALAVSCQSNSYTISGRGNELIDGDTIYITSDFVDGTPYDSVVVSKGKFEITGVTDTVRFCLVYCKRDNTINKPLFVEGGNISVTLSSDPERSKVYGTDTNNRWQQMSDSTMRIGKQINIVASYLYNNDRTEEEQRRQMAKIDSLQRVYDQYVSDLAAKNADNEFGRFLSRWISSEL